MLYSILVSLDVLIAAALIALVLLQRGPGATAGAAFGGGGGGASGTVFGAKGSSNFMSRSTAILAAAFFVNSIVLAYLASNRVQTESVIDETTIQQQVDIPQGPGDVPIVNIPEGTSAEEMGKIIQDEILKKASEKNNAVSADTESAIDDAQATADEIIQDTVEEVEQTLPSDIPQ